MERQLKQISYSSAWEFKEFLSQRAIQIGIGYKVLGGPECFRQGVKEAEIRVTKESIID